MSSLWWCREREKIDDWQEAPKFDCPLVWTIFGKWPENQILIPDWQPSWHHPRLPHALDFSQRFLVISGLSPLEAQALQ